MKRKDFFRSREYRRNGLNFSLPRPDVCGVCGKDVMTSYISKGQWVYKHTGMVNGTTQTTYHYVKLDKKGEKT